MNKHKPRAHKQKVEEGKLKKEECKICKRTFQWASFQSHVHIKNEIRYKCPTCGKIIRDYNGWKKHIRLVHKGEKKYHCNICSQNFGQKRSLSRHITTIHIGSKPFLCEICSTSFGHIHNLKSHINKDFSLLIYTCLIQAPAIAKNQSKTKQERGSPHSFAHQRMAVSRFVICDFSLILPTYRRRISSISDRVTQ